MNLVVDASVVVAALIDSGSTGQWAEELLLQAPLHAPQLMPVEAANILRRACLCGDIGEDLAALAHRDLLALPCELFPYELVAERAWALRANLTTYDACYVALAELMDAELATLDRALTRAPGPFCRFLLPPEDLLHDR
jgi:predicted nucleic acid-binding protein